MPFTGGPTAKLGCRSLFYMLTRSQSSWRAWNVRQGGTRIPPGWANHVPALVPLTAGPTIAHIRAALIAAGRTDTIDGGTSSGLPRLASGRSCLARAAKETAATGLASAGVRSARHVATLGYAAATGQLAGRLPPALDSGLSWLGQRTWFRPHQPYTLEADGVAALGVGLVRGT